MSDELRYGAHTAAELLKEYEVMEEDRARIAQAWADMPPCPICGAPAMQGSLYGKAAIWCPTLDCFDLVPVEVWRTLSKEVRRLRLAAADRDHWRTEAQAASNLADMQTTIVRAARLYRAAVQHLDGVQAAEAALFKALEDV